jgi:3-oxoacyl-[acyl-carrier protein] reductase
MKQQEKEKGNDKTAIVTGGSRGIRKEIAIRLAQELVNVVVCSRTEDKINPVAQEISKVTGNSSVLGIKCDVSIPSQVNSLVKTTIEEFESKTIDILVNNAGVAVNKKLIDTSEEEWTKL